MVALEKNYKEMNWGRLGLLIRSLQHSVVLRYAQNNHIILLLGQLFAVSKDVNAAVTNSMTKGIELIASDQPKYQV